MLGFGGRFDVYYGNLGRLWCVYGATKQEVVAKTFWWLFD